MSTDLTISCHCGAARQVVKTHDPQLSYPSLCHCDDCRHATGLLCNSYIPIAKPDPASVSGLVAYSSSSSPSRRRHFCKTCGCHVFRSTTAAEAWEVATGVVVESPADGPAGGGGISGRRHDHVEDTKDGGLSIWLPGDSSSQHPAPRQLASASATTTTTTTSTSTSTTTPTEPSKPTLPASCHCGRVAFHITRPDAPGRDAARSDYPDLTHPERGRPGARPRANTSGEKWWVRGPGRARYLAGTCACRPCRLTSGFEIQTWAFVPRANIFLHHVPPSPSPSPAAGDHHHDQQQQDDAAVPLDFAALPAWGVLQAYESSPGVLREFCPRCGATVFWHDRHGRPELVDVAAGLFRAAEGARAESWLEWWRGRCSYAEEVETGRTGWVAKEARGLIEDLERGMRGTDYAHKSGAST